MLARSLHMVECLYMGSCGRPGAQKNTIKAFPTGFRRAEILVLYGRRQRMARQPVLGALLECSGTHSTLNIACAENTAHVTHAQAIKKLEYAAAAQASSTGAATPPHKGKGFFLAVGIRRSTWPSTHFTRKPTGCLCTRFSRYLSIGWRYHSTGAGGAIQY